MIKRIYSQNKEIINYLFFGVLTTIVSLLTYYILTSTIFNPEKAIELQIANIISWIFSVTFAYITNRKYVFNSKSEDILSECSKFFTSRIATLLLDILIMFLGVTILKFNDKIIKIISQVLIIIGNYILSKIFVFNSKDNLKKDKKKRIINYIKNNKYIIIFFSLVFILFTYCSLQCFPASDDLPYSLFYRSPDRISTIGQIIRNQVSDYLTINGRIIVHSVVQFMLMFNRNLFSVVNALCIITSFIFMYKISVYFVDKKNINKLILFIIITSLFLLVKDLKYMIYWQAGSVNYVWVFMLLLIFIYYYLVNGLKKYKILNFVIIFILSLLHESSFCFMLFLIIFDIIKNLIENKKIGKKDAILYLIYIALCILGGLINIKSPGNIYRMSLENDWYNLSIIEKFKISLPVISKEVFGIFDTENMIPTLFILLLCITLFKTKDKYNIISGVFIFLLSILSYVTNNGWLYFILAIVIIIGLIIYNYKNKKLSIIVLWISFYSVIYSMAITPLYDSNRPNYYIYLFMICNICIFLNILSNRKIINNFIIVLFVCLLIYTGYTEYKIYSYIGSIKQERLNEILKVKKDNLKILNIKKINDKYSKYHAECNSPENKDYWAYNYFIYYYELPNDIDVRLVE